MQRKILKTLIYPFKNIQNFPNIALAINKLTITGITPFDGDTLFIRG